MAREESIASEVLAASLGGAISASVLYPLEVLKTKMQAETSTTTNDETTNDEVDETNDKDQEPTLQHTTSMLEYARHLYKAQGPRVFLEGMELSAFQSSMEKALYFFSYTILKKIYFSFSSSLGPSTNLLLGYLADWSHLPVTLPLDCWTTAIQTNTHKNQSGMEVLTTLLSEKGLKGMYKGMSAYVALCLKPALQYTIFEQLRARRLKGRHHQSSLSASEAFLLGMVSRAIATILVFPYLRVKVLMQTSATTNDEQPQSMSAVLGELCSSGGVSELFRGLGPELTRGVLSAAFMLMIKERIANGVHVALYGTKS